MHLKRIYTLFLGFFCGVLNGLFGAGGGVIAVPMLQKAGLEPKKAHATSIAIILPLTLATTVIYLFTGTIDLHQSWVYIPGGLAGAIAGSLLLKKLSNVWVKRIFGLVIILSGLRLLLK